MIKNGFKSVCGSTQSDLLPVLIYMPFDVFVFRLSVADEWKSRVHHLK